MKIKIETKSKKAIVRELTEMLLKDSQWVALNDFLNFVRISLPEDYFDVACEYSSRLSLYTQSNYQKTTKRYKDALDSVGVSIES